VADQFQIISGKEAQEFKDMGVVVEWESAADRKTTLFRIIPATLEKKSIPREIIVHITGDVEIHPGIDTLDGSLELRQWASLLIWCTRLAYDKVYYIFNVDQLRFK
jgi:hypothetical protein